jgi:hypothetical protein
MTDDRHASARYPVLSAIGVGVLMLLLLPDPVLFDWWLLASIFAFVGTAAIGATLDTIWEQKRREGHDR